MQALIPPRGALLPPLSKDAVLDNKKAIRGGIPLVFPQFGKWELGPNHGFARISTWTLAEQGETPEGDVYAVFQLCDSDATRKMWDHAFELRYTVTLGKTRLSTSLSIENKGSAAFDFQTLLHTYFRVPSVSEAAVGGLRGVHYRNQVGVRGMWRRGDGAPLEAGAACAPG